MMRSTLSMWVWLYAVGVCVGVSIHTPVPITGRSVVSVRYEGGHLTELRVAQEGSVAEGALGGSSDTLSDRRRCCAELCRAGLGGEPCGSLCDDLVPGDFRPTKNESYILTESKILKPKLPHFHHQIDTENGDKNSEISKDGSSPNTIGRPRIEVCPVLCDNNLGQPICGCKPNNATVNWSSVCNSFCRSNAYQLSGCPICEIDNDILNLQMATAWNSAEYANMQEVWVEWCHYQCKKGDGGAACNCDLAPLMMDPQD